MVASVVGSPISIPQPSAILSLVLYFGVEVGEEVEDIEVEDYVVDVKGKVIV